MKQVIIHSSNGHLGYAPTKEKSFWDGTKKKPDFYIADSGSADIGPRYLGQDVCSSPRSWQKHDLRLMLLAAREQKVPMIIGSAGDQGTNKSVDMYVELIKEIAQEEGLSNFKIASFYSEVTKEELLSRIENGEIIRGLGSARKDLTKKDLDQTDKIVAVMGVHPYLEALNNGADVIIGGRSSDTCVYAAAAIWKGMPEATSYFAGKALECSSFCAEPYGAKETVIGYVREDSVVVEAMADFQRCTPASIAGHSMYERSNPFEEIFPGGKIDLTNCNYQQISEKATEVTGIKYTENELTFKLEGSGKVGQRRVIVVGVRDPLVIEQLDEAIDWAKSEVEKFYGSQGIKYKLFFHIYGKNALMKNREPIKNNPHEVGVVVEAICDDEQLAHEIALMGGRGIFYARTSKVKGTAGTASVLFAEVLKAEPAYKWTVNHVMTEPNWKKICQLKYQSV